MDNLTTDQIIDIRRAMANYGGSFVRALAEAMRLADNQNLRTIVEAFPEIIKQYTAFVPTK